MGYVFQKLCSKAISADEVQALKLYTDETICLFELYFPPSFFDVMVHLVRHCVEQLEQCGPVHSRWMYGIERYMFRLKRYVRNRSRPEGCIATGNLYNEALGFITEHYSLYPNNSRIWDVDYDAKDSGEVLEGGCHSRELDDAERHALHEFVVMNSSATADWRQEYEARHSEHEANRAHRMIQFQAFSTWLEHRVEQKLWRGDLVVHDVALLSKAPGRKVFEYPSMWAYGNHYRCKSCLWGGSHCSYDSGVAAVIKQTC
jgi:hypothetical protein